MAARLCKVGAGSFIKGSSDPDLFGVSPPRKIYLKEYFIDETPVTCNQYSVFTEWFLETNDHSFCHPMEPPNKDHRPHFPLPDIAWRADLPVTGIDWFDAYAYASWAGMRLPTDAEWEKAAKGTDGRRWPWGNETGLVLGKVSALFDDEGVLGRSFLSYANEHPTGVSPYGCLEMAGNVWELCVDTWTTDWHERMEAINPVNLDEGDRVVCKGGCYYSSENNTKSAIRAGICREQRCEVRDDFDPSYPVVGFRCASDTPNPSGPFGRTRYLKEPNSSFLERDELMPLFTADGAEWGEGYDTDARGLFYRNGEPASLYDFLNLYNPPPPKTWMESVTEVKLREAARGKPVDVRITSIEGLAVEEAETGRKSNLVSILSERVAILKELADIDDEIDVQFSNSQTLNGYTIPASKGYVIKFNAGLMRVLHSIGTIFSILYVQENADQQLLSNELAMVATYVVSQGAFGFASVSIQDDSDLENLNMSIEIARCSLATSEMLSVFCVAHELGHIIHRHSNEVSGETFEQEYEADRFAMELSLKYSSISENPEIFYTVLGFWFEFLQSCELATHGIGFVSDSHPTAAARRKTLLDRSIEYPHKQDLIDGLKMVRHLPDPNVV